MQDNAPTHGSTETRAYVEKRTSPNVRLLGWPPQSPDLNVMDYHMWVCWGRCVVDPVQTQCIATIESDPHLKRNICQAWQALGQDAVRRAILSFPTWLGRCIEKGGAQFEHRQHTRKQNTASAPAPLPPMGIAID